MSVEGSSFRILGGKSSLLKSSNKSETDNNQRRPSRT
jgi:hypothetical protein